MKSALLVVAGAALAGLMGMAAGHRLALERTDFAPVGASRLYISGPRVTDLRASASWDAHPADTPSRD